jgi:hypothetical protein
MVTLCPTDEVSVRTFLGKDAGEIELDHGPGGGLVLMPIHTAKYSLHMIKMAHIAQT